MTKIRIDLEGEMAEQAISAVIERLEELDKAVDRIADIANMNADSLDIIEAAIEDLKKAQAKMSEAIG